MTFVHVNTLLFVRSCLAYFCKSPFMHFPPYLFVYLFIFCLFQNITTDIVCKKSRLLLCRSYVSSSQDCHVVREVSTPKWACFHTFMSFLLCANTHTHTQTKAASVSECNRSLSGFLSVHISRAEEGRSRVELKDREEKIQSCILKTR